MRKELYRPSFRPSFLPLVLGLSMISVLDIQAQVAYASSARRQNQQEKEHERPPASVAPNQLVSLKVDNANLVQVLDQIEAQTSLVFVYSNDDLKSAQKVSLNVKDNRLEDVLQMILLPLNINYEFIANKIILKRAELATTIGNQQQDITITGRVVDQKGEPIPGANIRLKGQNIGTVTNGEGNYSLKIPAAQANGTLLISSVGYTPSEIAINGRKSIVAMLNTDSKDLGEIVVTAYGQQKKGQVTAAISTVSSKDITGRPVVNMYQALQGQAPNLIIQQNTAEPGAKLTMNIRGVGSLTGNEPLIIIDGIVAGGDGLRNLNPYDVENISVLKDAASAAIYGSQAANGVIYITTKKGNKDERPSVQYNGMYGWQTPTTLPRQMEAWQYMTLKNEALVNSGKTPQFTPENIQYWHDRGSEPAMLTEMIRKYTPQQNHSLSVTGGGKSSSYLFSLGYLDQGNMLQNKYVPQDFYYKRYNARLNVSVDVSQYVKVTGNAAYTRSNFRKQAADIGMLMRDAMRVPRIYPVKDSLGNWVVPSLTSNSVFALLSDYGYETQGIDNLMGGLDVVITPVKHFKINFNASANYSIENNDRRINKFDYAPYYTTATPPLYNERHTSVYKNLITNVYTTAEYENTFGKHYVKGQVGVRSDATNESWGLRADRFGTTNLDNDWSIGGGYIPKPDGTFDYRDLGTYNDIINPNLYALNSLFGRMNYVYADKYLAEFTWRYDGSSKLAPGHRWQFFPAFSLGWRLTEEAFMQDIKERIGNFKLRYSWGQVGNSNIGGFNYLARVALNNANYSFNNSPANGSTFSTFNDLLKWEISTMSNYGIDADFFNGKLTATFDYFDKQTSGIYLFQTVPGTAGTSAPLENVGKVDNKGWEFTINYRLRTGAFNHNFGFNLSDNLNKVIKFGQESVRGSDVTFIIKEGYPIASYYGYKSDGLYQNLDDLKNAPKVPFAYNQQVMPGDIKYIDRNKDGVIDENDRYIFGNPFPRYTFGFTYNVSWKNFDLTMFWQGVGKRTQFLRGDIVEAFHNNEDHAMVQHLDRWTPTNPNASYPRLTIGAADANNFAYSDYWLFDTKYLRLKNFQVGYSLPASLLQRAKIQGARVYFTSQNLITIMPKRFREIGVDPEFSQFDDKLSMSNYNPIAGRNYPNAATFAFGIDLKF
ncbi:TonB-linked outer membrane protein, SusC/RagA family [Chitinophaga terrae (ex Kim and Jung 2007)]|uniref:TonB-linked outer membrane protein, SusC/RagA family n=1 Tax=Chitinophaga terrae (ex Kim and Jung 2007) TaxID=408074 RepID=A0A1H4FP01_9BACT|nr:TonB-dependent receptor [Chitinophaga terrae (ex Kim and Jung 2007)]MDQ0108766.1 TonB-linked SusC/RagA family outer membrane protein [Chitinophaga terrae (ex Kim and Jung 2007)]SEA98212.1 TonB-linked outer membrane protein, SusC/RagA family [Chitinophaga terrae (ex Kim and Jung 2007)]